MITLLYILFAVGILYLSSTITIAILNRNAHPSNKPGGPIKISLRTTARDRYAGKSRPPGKLYRIARLVLYVSALAFWALLVLFFTQLFKKHL